MNIRPFEIALIGFFAIVGLAGLFFLSAYKPDPTEKEKLYGESVLIWGTLDAKTMNDLLFQFTNEDKALSVVKYAQIDSRSFENELLNAIAEGRSPDLILLPHSLLVSYRPKLQPISFETLSARTFRDTYIDGADIFMLSDGTYGLPFAVDPLVLYWNRDIFSSGGLAQPPKTWETLVAQTTKALVQTNDNFEITQSAVALGEYANIAHAKDILAMLFFQAGSSLIEENNRSYSVTLNKGPENALSPGDSVLTFYTQFAIPNKELYSWNRSRQLDRTEFVGGTLGMYFGLGSEVKSIERENSNLNFDIASIPQGSGVTTERNYGNFYAFSIPRASQNMQGAYAVALYLGSPAQVQKIADAYNFAPVHRVLHGGQQSDPFKNVVYRSALIARGWLDPSPKESDQVFARMVEGVTSGRTRLKNVMIDTAHELESLF